MAVLHAIDDHATTGALNVATKSAASGTNAGDKWPKSAGAVRLHAQTVT